MKWILASTKPPTGNAEEYSWRRAKDKQKFNPMLNINGNILEYAWLRSEFSFDEVEYLDESPDLPPTDEQAIVDEAERLYPYGEGRNIQLPFVTVNAITDTLRAAHIACAKTYSSRVRELEAQLQHISTSAAAGCGELVKALESIDDDAEAILLADPSNIAAKSIRKTIAAALKKY